MGQKSQINPSTLRLKQLDDGAVELWAAYVSEPSDLHRNALWVHYQPLVQYHGRRIFSTMPTSANLDEADIFGLAQSGLLEAIKRFNPGRGVVFRTYAVGRIRGSVIDGLRDNDWVPRLERLRQKKNRDLKVPFVTSLSDRGCFAAYSFRDRADCDDMDISSIVRDGKQLDQHSRRLDTQDFWRVATRGLSKSESLLLLLYYRERLTMKEIGEQLGVSESRVSQVHNQIISRMRRDESGRMLELCN